MKLSFHTHTISLNIRKLQWVKSVVISLGVAGVFSFFVATQVNAGEGFFDKIGDGWKQGKWVPGIPSVKPQTLQEVIFPICWGNPQNCRDSDETKETRKQGQPASPVYEASFRVDCTDKYNGRNRGDSTIFVRSSTSIEDAKSKALDAYRTSDLCQVDPNYQDRSRVMVPGSGRFI